jgi:hypothetical protein
MSRLSKFQRRPTTLELEIEKEDGTIEIEQLIIKPFKTPDMQLLMDVSNPDKCVAATHAILKKVIGDNIPDYTAEEYNSMSYAYADKILNAVMDVNSLDANDRDGRKKKIIEEIKAKQIAAGLIKPSNPSVIEGGAVLVQK